MRHHDITVPRRRWHAPPVMSHRGGLCRAWYAAMQDELWPEHAPHPELPRGSGDLIGRRHGTPQHPGRPRRRPGCVIVGRAVGRPARRRESALYAEARRAASAARSRAYARALDDWPELPA